VEAVAGLVASRTLRRPPTLGAGRLICIDGRTGSGKTTLGRAVLGAVEEHRTARLLHMDDAYDGWTGLGDVGTRLAQDLIAPLNAGRPGRYHRYDWHEERFADWVTVDPVDVLVLEGVGSAATAYRDRITTSVWVEAPRELRLSRAVARDGEDLRPQLVAWMEEEDRYFAREQTPHTADLLADGTGRQPPVERQ